MPPADRRSIDLTPSPPTAAPMLGDRFRGCLLGGAVGDALGAPVEFLSHARIVAAYGEAGIRDLASSYGRLGALTDDTQMALFTAEGLLRAHVRERQGGLVHWPSVLAAAYQRWLHTQGEAHPLHEHCLDGWLVTHPALHARRAPGNTCLSALRAMRGLEVPASNHSKGCGGVMRVAPVGLYLAALNASATPTSAAFKQALQRAVELGSDAAAITHGHPTGQLASGAFAALVLALLLGTPLLDAIELTLTELAAFPGREETSAAIGLAANLAQRGGFSTERLRQLGEGWIAEEALAIGLYCALTAPYFEMGVIHAVNHDGDSDSTGLIAGHLLGAIQGLEAIPERWLAPLELRSALEQVADDLANCGQWQFDPPCAEAHRALTCYPAS